MFLWRISLINHVFYELDKGHLHITDPYVNLGKFTSSVWTRGDIFGIVTPWALDVLGLLYKFPEALPSNTLAAYSQLLYPKCLYTNPMSKSMSPGKLNSHVWGDTFRAMWLLFLRGPCLYLALSEFYISVKRNNSDAMQTFFSSAFPHMVWERSTSDAQEYIRSK